MIKVIRKSSESVMEVSIYAGPVKEDYRKKIMTPLPFLNHMIEHIVWRSGLNIEAKTTLKDFNLTHLICEDLGITLGKALGEYVKENISDGMYGFGDGFGIIDEARSFAAVSFESRAYYELESNTVIPSETEGMLSEDLGTFLEGIAQGACMTLQINLQKGHNGHHIWEAIYRSVGLAIGKAVSPVPERKGMTSGVAGLIEFTTEKD